jgi:hypothetical protein
MNLLFHQYQFYLLLLVWLLLLLLLLLFIIVIVIMIFQVNLGQTCLPNPGNVGQKIIYK